MKQRGRFMRNRKFIKNSLQHTYQRSIDKGVVFYSTEDYLVLFTLCCTYSKVYKIGILGICIMLNHIHYLLESNSKKDMSDFIQVVTSVFVKMYNQNILRKGSLFTPLYGSSSKYGNKKIRTIIAYLYNNPVEKNICSKADEYRWSFLAYANNKFPFSEKIRKNQMSKRLRDLLKIVDERQSKNQALTYSLLNGYMPLLNKKEKSYLIDYVISTYSCINYSKLISYYGSFEKLKIAINSNTGSEYEIKEDFDNFSDKYAKELIKLTNESGFFKYSKRNFPELPKDELEKLVLHLSKSKANIIQISRFLHISSTHIAFIIKQSHSKKL